MTAEIWDAWARGEPDVARRHTGDPDRFRAAVEARAGELHARVFTLLDWWHSSLAAGALSAGV